MSEQYPLGYFKIVKVTQKKQGSMHGRVMVELDDHCLAYYLKGLNHSVDHYETQERNLPDGLGEDDITSFNFVKQLRGNTEDARNATLAE